MNKIANQWIVTAAIAGVLSGAVVSTSVLASEEAPKGHCMGANACKGQGGCKTAANECKGQNCCKGTGFLEKTKAECEKMAKKNKKIKWEAAS